MYTYWQIGTTFYGGGAVYFGGLPFASVGLTFLGWGNVCCHRSK
jgi:hypothetical protein